MEKGRFFDPVLQHEDLLLQFLEGLLQDGDVNLVFRDLRFQSLDVRTGTGFRAPSPPPTAPPYSPSPLCQHCIVVIPEEPYDPTASRLNTEPRT